MNRVRYFCAVMALCLTFAASAHAGDISCGVTDPPPPPPQQAATITGDGVLDFAATVLEGVLSLL